MKKLSLEELRAQKSGQIKGNLEAISGGCCLLIWALKAKHCQPAATPEPVVVPPVN